MIQLKGAALRRTDAGVEHAAKIVGVAPSRMLAVLKIEAPKGPFEEGGRPTILFEAHKFYKHLSGSKRSRAVAEKLAHPKWKGLPYGPSSAQYGKLLRALKIDETAALKSCSWGSPQIMGENHAMVGYRTVQEMVEAFAASEDEQLAAMARFIVAAGLAKHMRAGNWAKFAAGYNGPGYAENKYDVKLAAADRQMAAAARPRGILGVAEPDDDYSYEPEVDVDNGIDPERERIRGLQIQLDRLGYSLGDLDGKLGTLTTGATGAFQKDRGIEVTGEFDAATVAELDVAEAEGWARPIAEKRAAASSEIIAAKVPEAKSALKAKLLGYGGTIASAVGFVGSSVTTYAGDAWQSTATVRRIFSDVPTPVWFAVAGVVVAVMAYQARKSQKETNAAFRTGART